MEKAFKFFENSIFEWLSIFNKSIILYRKTQKVKKNDLIEKKNSMKNGDNK